MACYRACDIARELMRAGLTVRACLTDGAEKFVSRALFEALTGQPALVDTFEEPVRGRMAHIDWARAADLLLIAPATANTLNKIASGTADDMLTTLALAYEGPLVLAPAMNPSMYAHDTTQASLRMLAERAVLIVEPTEGDVACGESGQGKLASYAEIVEAALTVLQASRSLQGKKVLITSGPTYEPIDSVRFIGNRSSGKMGAALAKAARLMGADVTVVTGPTSVPLPKGVEVVRVRTAVDMLEAALLHVNDADLVIGAAAVADFRPAQTFAGKLRRSDGTPELELVENPDVIRTLASHVRPTARVVAFAAEPDDGLDAAREKLKRKGVHAVAVNDVSDPAIGFESDQNALTLVTENGQTTSGRRSKLACALWLLEQIAPSTG